ncbi:MAG: carboxymuconolactone decarboxylase family protein [Mycobacteriaceae bacterium]|nr:carboxymuconolactone decarboxylase family protein [Mycobacteriaceae bacterium]
MIDELARLVSLAPRGPAARINALVRGACAGVLSLPPLTAETEVDKPSSEAEEAAVDFAEQFSADVTGISGDQRARLLGTLGAAAFGTVVLTYIADFVPRVVAGLASLDLAEGVPEGTVDWDRTTDPADAVFNGFLPAVARKTALDPLTAEIVRLRGAGQHRCRLCKSLREASALEAGGSEDVYDEILFYETSRRLSEAHKAALRYVDALIWSPAAISPEVAADMRARFTRGQAVEVTLDVMRNASNKIAVAMAADAARVEHGTERYRILADGQTQYE